ncbi:hypothetical protein INT43_001561 [Umbelopsis isabellina]|uniref:Uncharacterized protein n=1 Tax=Mortierella isabellina TaxID=91625 RepID=A0A8H7PEB4_MORIS|nr:hypothetical protein INT43_001561 [Umbelopsis isabellina]
MQNKTLLVLFSVFLISCFALTVSAFSFGSSDKKDVGAQEIVKRGGGEDKDDDDHKHGHDDDDHEDDGHGHGDDECDDAISRASASFAVGGKTYKIPCGTGAVDIEDICTEAVLGAGGIGSGEAVVVFGTGTGAITTAYPCGSGSSNVDLDALCAAGGPSGGAAIVTFGTGTGAITTSFPCGTGANNNADLGAICQQQTNTFTFVAGTATSTLTAACGSQGPINLNNFCDPYCAGLIGASVITQTVTATAACPSIVAAPTVGANVVVTVGTGTAATVQTVSCPTNGPQAVTIGTGTAASVTTVTC